MRFGVSYSIRIRGSARRELAQLAQDARERVIAAIAPWGNSRWLVAR